MLKNVADTFVACGKVAAGVGYCFLVVIVLWSPIVWFIYNAYKK